MLTNHENIDLLVERLHKLELVLNYCTQEKTVFTTTERIWINYQRAIIFEQMDDLKGYQKQRRANFHLATDLEEKVKQTVQIINKTNWTPTIYKFQKY